MSTSEHIRALEELAAMDAEVKALEEKLAEERGVLNGLKESLKKLGVEPMPLGPKDMDDLVARETAANLELIKAAGIKP